MDIEDTIAAIASPPGKGVRGIVRISGPDCGQCLEQVFVFPADDLSKINTASVLKAELKLDGNRRLPGELMYWPDQRSYTRQPTAEFHTIGSPPLLKLALSEICQAGARLANPGEFTLRAFLAGRIDLTQAEAVLAIIDAEGDDEFKGALKQLAGGLAGPLTEAKDQLTYVLAELEAGLDFVEEDIEFIDQDELIGRLQQVAETIDQIIDQIESRQHESEIAQVALIGMPNAGKSSLFNCLAGRRRAIVTPVAGTTTDFLSVSLELSGQRVELIDTAGLEANRQEGEIAGQAQLQREQVENRAMVQLLCVDFSRELTDWETERLEQGNESTIVVQTKSDLDMAEKNRAVFDRFTGQDDFVATSSENLVGIEKLLDTIRRAVVKLEPARTEVVGATVLRAASSLFAARKSIELALQAAQVSAGEEVVASEIREALNDLGLVVGTVYTDDILDVVFSRFCIGK